ncbi:MAG: hypothetical protein ACRCTJ_06970 [Brevinema sp.]
MIRLIMGEFIRTDEIKNIYNYDFNRSDADVDYINNHNSHVIFILQDQIRIQESHSFEFSFDNIISFLKK